MKHHPKVTVVTVCYNCCDVIEQTMCNVLKQTYRNMEYIVIDGGSTDGTRDIVARYANRLAYWVSEPDRGIYDAMNKGVRAASGEWIIFRNAGDYFFKPTTIADVFEWYADRGEALIVGGMRSFGEEGFCDRYYNRMHDDVWSRAFVPHPSVFVRMAVQKANPFPVSYRISGDYCFFQKLMLEGVAVALYSGIVSLFDCEGGISSSRLSLCWREILTIRRQLGAPNAVVWATRKRLLCAMIVEMLVGVLKKAGLRSKSNKPAGWTLQPLELTLKDI